MNIEYRVTRYCITNVKDKKFTYNFIIFESMLKNQQMVTLMLIQIKLIFIHGIVIRNRKQFK